MIAITLLFRISCLYCDVIIILIKVIVVRRIWINQHITSNVRLDEFVFGSRTNKHDRFYAQDTKELKKNCLPPSTTTTLYLSCFAPVVGHLPHLRLFVFFLIFCNYLTVFMCVLCLLNSPQINRNRCAGECAFLRPNSRSKNINR